MEVLLRLGEVARAGDTLALAARIELSHDDQISAAPDFDHVRALLAGSH